MQSSLVAALCVIGIVFRNDSTSNAFDAQIGLGLSASATISFIIQGVLEKAAKIVSAVTSLVC